MDDDKHGKGMASHLQATMHVCVCVCACVCICCVLYVYIVCVCVLCLCVQVMLSYQLMYLPFMVITTSCIPVPKKSTS